MRFITKKDMQKLANRFSEVIANKKRKDYALGFMNAMDCLGIVAKADPDHKDKMIAGFTFRKDDWESPFGMVSIKPYLQELKGYLQQQIYELEYKVANCNDKWFVQHYGKVDLKACARAIEVLNAKIKICDWFIDNGADIFYC